LLANPAPRRGGQQGRLRPLPLKQRKAALARISEGPEGWIALTNDVVGEGRALYLAGRGRLGGIVAKRLDDAYLSRLMLAAVYRVDRL
jgi:ATP-dependent DNA ligase